MKNQKETLVEKIFKPIRINPVGAIPTIFGITSIVNTKIESFNIETFVQTGIGAAALGLGGTVYVLSTIDYFKNKNKFKNKFNKLYGKTQMNHYCDRQLFYVLSIENGHREKVNELIKNTDSKIKKYNWIPHI